MPYFKNNIIDKFIFTFEFNFIDDDLINMFSKHYNSFNSFCTNLVRNKLFINIEIEKCN